MNLLETYAGNVTESNDGSTSAVTGSIATADADGETVSLKLMGGTTSGAVQTLTKPDGYGTLTLYANGTYKYELDNTNSDLSDLNDGEIEHEGFVVEVKDAYHTTYQMLDFEILGKDEVVVNQSGTGFDIELIGSEPIAEGSVLRAEINGITDPNGKPGTPADYIIEWYARGAPNEQDDFLGGGENYTVKATDAGRSIFAKVSYTDNDNFNETLESVAEFNIPGSEILVKEKSPQLLKCVLKETEQRRA
jgi:VCBS repeat-containing protein